MHIVRAVSFKVASTLMFAIMGAQVRYLAGAYPEGQVAFFRSLFALIPILIVFGWRGQLRARYGPSARKSICCAASSALSALCHAALADSDC